MVELVAGVCAEAAAQHDARSMVVKIFFKFISGQFVIVAGCPIVSVLD
jgi:hypothetical protein